MAAEPRETGRATASRITINRNAAAASRSLQIGTVVWLATLSVHLTT